MKTVWNESTIRSEMARLDKKTGLKGAELPIVLIMQDVLLDCTIQLMEVLLSFQTIIFKIRTGRWSLP